MSTTTDPKAATPKDDRMNTADFDKLLQAIRENSLRTESSIQDAFLASWRDLACSHSTQRLQALWDVLDEVRSPFKSQVSLAMRALAGMASPMKSGQKWHRTGRCPLSCAEGCWMLQMEDTDRHVLAERAEWRYHFRAIQVKAARSAFTWAEAVTFAERIRKAGKRGLISEKDAKLFYELIAEIERISAR